MGPINPDNPQQWQRFVEAWTRKREGPYAREVLRAINAVAREAADAIEAGLDPNGGPLATGGHAVEIERILLKRNRAIAEDFAALIARNAKSAMGHERKDFQTDFMTWLARFLSTRTARDVTRISQTTRQQIQEAITIGQREGMGAAQTARIIRDRTRVIGAARAMTIARTETGIVAASSQERALDALTIDRRKKWVAALGERTRSTHAEANQQERGRDEAFDVGGAKLMHPLDPNGPAREIINCRCVSVALTT